MQRKRSSRGVALGAALVALVVGAGSHAAKHADDASVSPVTRSDYAGIVGTNRDDAGKKMKNLGFKMKKEGNEDRGSLWWNATTKECVELIGKNDRVKSIEPTSSSRCH
jgi:hypothetical protein